MRLSLQPIRMLRDRLVIQVNLQALAGHVDGCADIRVGRNGRQPKPLAKNIEATIASNKPNQVIPSPLRFRQGVSRRERSGRKAQAHAGLRAGLHRVFSPRAYCSDGHRRLLFEGPAGVLQGGEALERMAQRSMLLPPVVEFFYDAISRRVGWLGVRWLHVVGEAEADQGTHLEGGQDCRKTPSRYPLADGGGPRAAAKCSRAC